MIFLYLYDEIDQEKEFLIISRENFERISIFMSLLELINQLSSWFFCIENEIWLIFRDENLTLSNTSEYIIYLLKLSPEFCILMMIDSIVLYESYRSIQNFIYDKYLIPKFEIRKSSSIEYTISIQNSRS